MNLNDWFEKGMTFEDYRNSMEVNQQELTQVYEQLIFTEDDLATLKEVAKRNWRGIVLTADWCGDAALNVPVLQRMAEISEMELHFLIRDDNLELMDQYLTNGKSRSIPIFIFIDQEGNETMVWGPRSQAVEEIVSSLKAGLPANDSPDFTEKQQNMFKQFREKITSDPEVWRTVIDSVKVKFTV